MCGWLPKGAVLFLIFFSSHSLKQWSHEWINSPGQQKTMYFLSITVRISCWIPVLGWLTPELWGHWSCCRKPRVGDVMFCQMDVTPVQSLLGLHAMRCNTQWLPSSAMEKKYREKKNSTMWKKHRSYCAYKSSKWFAVLFTIEQTVDRSKDGLLKAGVDRTIGKIPCQFCQGKTWVTWALQGRGCVQHLSWGLQWSPSVVPQGTHSLQGFPWGDSHPLTTT